MKKLKVKNKFVLVDDEDFDELNKYNWHLNIAGYPIKTFYKNGTYKHIMMHRYILKNYSDNLVVDHIDRNILNNQKSNLRLCTQSENIFNSPRKKNNKSGYVGVRLNKLTNKWEAYIMKNRIKYHLGVFKLKIDAISARKKAEIKLYPNFNRHI